MNNINISEIFSQDAQQLLTSREKAVKIHGSNIRAAGNEIEIEVRNYFKRMLPQKYYVTQGHLIDINANTSSQLDIIISDNSNLPSLLKTKDGTEYVPIDSVYIIGEIKSTYYHSQHYIEKFSDVIENIRTSLYHEEVENTLYDGLRDDSDLHDLLFVGKNKILNRIFSFMLFIDRGDFDCDKVSEYFKSRDNKYLPNVVVILNQGVILYTYLDEDKMLYHKYPEDNIENYEWGFTPFVGLEGATLEGNHLSFLYHLIIDHLSKSNLEPPQIGKYLSKMLVGRKSLYKKF